MSQPGVQPFPRLPSGDARPFRASWQARLLALLVAAYAIYALGQLDFSHERFIRGLDNGARFTMHLGG